MSQLDVGTKLAFDRTRVAFDRTMMAWIRTSASLITFGFSIYKFFQVERGLVKTEHRLIGSREFAVLMVGIGLLSLLLGVVEYRDNMRSLIEQYPEMRRSRTGLVAAFIAVLGVVALLAVVLRQ